MLVSDFWYFTVTLPWQIFDSSISFKMAAFINVEAMTSSNFEILELQISTCNHIVDLQEL